MNCLIEENVMRCYENGRQIEEIPPTLYIQNLTRIVPRKKTCLMLFSHFVPKMPGMRCTDTFHWRINWWRWSHLKCWMISQSSLLRVPQCSRATVSRFHQRPKCITNPRWMLTLTSTTESRWTLHC